VAVAPTPLKTPNVKTTDVKTPNVKTKSKN
jgi:hypothetical protein